MKDTNCNIKIGKGCKIDETVWLGFEENGEGKIIIGDRVKIRPMAMLRTCGGIIAIGYGSNVGFCSGLHGMGGLNIGREVLIGPYVGIYAQGHNFDGKKLISSLHTKPCAIVIKKGAWIGSHSVIVGPVTIGEGTVVGAGSVVVSDLPDYAICVGNPCKVIKYRKEEVE